MTMTRPAPGFTLLEMVMVLVILGVLAAVSAPMLSSTFDSYFIGQQIVEADAQARLAMERMLREFRFAASYTITGTDKVSFTYQDGSVSPPGIEYSLSSGNLIRKNTSAGTQETLATGISNLQFTQTVGGASISPGMQISFNTTAGDNTLPLRSRVYPRN